MAADADLAIGLDAVRAALIRERLAPAGFEVLSPPNPRKRGRATLRVTLAGGNGVKARWLESGEEGARLFAVRADLGSAFAPAIAAHGRVLLESWIEGTSVDGLALAAHAEAIAADAGAILGNLHARSVQPAMACASTAPWRSEAERDLATLVDAGKLDVVDATALAARLAASDPTSTPLALIHRDFCGENLVRDERGRLRVIDNEWLMHGPAGFDLGRTFCRWPMPLHAWKRFLASYATAMPLDLQALVFWQITAALFGARIRLGSQRVAESLAVVRRLARESTSSTDTAPADNQASAAESPRHGP